MRKFGTGLALLTAAALIVPTTALLPAVGAPNNGNGNSGASARPAAPSSPAVESVPAAPGKPTNPGNGSGSGSGKGTEKDSGAPAEAGTKPSSPGNSSNGSGSGSNTNPGGSSSADSGNSIGRPTEIGRPASPGAASSASASSGTAASGSSASSANGTPASSSSSGSKAAASAASSARRIAVTPDRSLESRALARGAARTPAEQANQVAIASCLQDEFAKASKASPAKTRSLSAAQIADLEESCEEETGDLGDYIVQFTPGSNASDVAKSAREKSAIKETNRFTVKRTYSNVFPGMLVSANPRQITALRKNPNVTLIEPDGQVMAIATQTPAPWGLDRSDQQQLPLSGSYTYGATAPGVAAYIIDTGVRSDHVDFTGRVTSGFTAVADGKGTTDCNGHGTHVAGTVGGSTYGIAKGVSLVPVRVLDCNGSGTWSGVIAGLDWVAGHHAAGTPAVANMSLGGGANSSVDDAVRAVINDGVTVVVAAGNSAADACSFSPARTAAALTVAATDSSDNQASFSNRGTCVDLYAPGVSIPSAWYTSTTATASLSGTSMAAPHVAGAAALLLAANPAASPAAISAAITSAATADVVRGATTGTPNRLLFTGAAPVTPTPEEPVTPEEPPASDDPAATVPDAPTGVSAAGGSKSATVVWALPRDGGSALKGQTVWVFDARGKRQGSVSVSPTSTSVTITGLAPRKQYSFSVSAWNVVGTGSESARSNTITTAR